MRVLVVDTATRRATVALAEDERIVSAEHYDQGCARGEQLIGMIERVLGNAATNPAEIDLVAAGAGPGSFTGVRVGVATAKGLAMSLGVPIVGVSSLHAMALAATRLMPNRAVVSVIDAKKNEVFVELFDAQGWRGAGPESVRSSALAAWILRCVRDVGAFVIAGEFARSLDLGDLPLLCSQASDLPSGEAIAELAVRKWILSRSDELDLLDPEYVRRPDVAGRAEGPQ